MYGKVVTDNEGESKHVLSAHQLCFQLKPFRSTRLFKTGSSKQKQSNRNYVHLLLLKKLIC